MVKCKSRTHQSDGDRVHTNIHPTRVLDAEPEVEGEAGEKAPCGKGSLTTADGQIVEGGPRVVVEQAFQPRRDIAAF